MECCITFIDFSTNVVAVYEKRTNPLLTADVENMLRPEEIAILEQNEAPNLEIISTVN